MARNQILILDDNSKVCEVLEKAARAAGFNAEAVGAPAEFYVRYASQRPEIVVLDIVLGDTDVCEVLDFLGRQQVDGARPTEVILISGYDYRILHSMVKVAKARRLHVLDAFEKRSDSGQRLSQLLRGRFVSTRGSEPVAESKAL